MMVKKTKPVTVNDREVLVEKKGLLDWAEVASRFDNFLGSIFNNMDSMTEQNWTERLPKLIAENLPVVIDILEIGTPVPREELEHNLGLDEAIDLIIAMVELNNLLTLSDKAKNLLTLVRTSLQKKQN
jgi:hypothetical protein